MNGYGGFKHLSTFVSIAVMALLVSCVGGEGGKKKADCSSGQILNSVTRKCEGAKIESTAPTLTLASASVTEDSGSNSIVLSYVDSENDLATACTVTSASASGIRKSLDYQGIRITSKSNIDQGHYIGVRFISAGSLSIVPTTSGLYKLITVNIINGLSTVEQVKSAIEANVTANSWVDVTAMTNYSMTANSSYQYLTSIPCACAGGVCTATVVPSDEYSGVSEFTYSLTDNDGTSSRVTSLTVTAVNDFPVISPTSVSLTINEDQQLASSNIATYFSVTAHDSVDGDPLGLFLSYEKVLDPSHGTLSLSSTGSFVYTPTLNYNGTDSFQFRVYDSGGLRSSTVTINLTLNPVGDAPITSSYSISSFAEDSKANGSSDLISLTYTDAEADLATGCQIVNISKAYVSTNCSCPAGVCQVGITGYPNQSGSGYLDYYVVAGGDTSNTSRIYFTVTAAADAPFAFATVNAGNTDGLGNINFNESATHVPSSISFTLDAATDPEGGTLTYEIVSSPGNGSLSNCMGLDGSSNSDLTCDYLPKDGNLNDDTDASPSTKAQALIGDLSVTAKNYGKYGDDITIKLIDASGSPSGVPYAWVTGKTINVLIYSGLTTSTQVRTAIEANTEASSLVTLADGGAFMNAGTTILGSAGTPGEDGADYFTYRVRDTLSNYSQTVKVNISINPVDDDPVICEYSKYSKAKECGIQGCREYGSPVGNITPSASDLYYYDESTGACWKSDTTLADKWTLVDGHIGNQAINEKDVIVIDDIAFDEGGGDTSEDTQSLYVTNVSISNTILITANNIKFYYNGSLVGNAGTLPGIPVSLLDGASSGDDGDFKIEITPVGGVAGSSDITLTFEACSGASGCGSTTTKTFTITVNPVTAQHGGWTNISALGPKIDKTDTLIGTTTKICPYSLSMCNSGSDCKGTSTPSMTPDHIDSIFWNSSADTCYKVSTTSLQTTLQGVTYVAKKSSGASITYTSGGSAGSETVSVSGTAITVQIQAGASGSTPAHIVSAIESSVAASKLVKVSVSDGSITQVAMTATTLTGPGVSSWTAYSATCNATPSAYEPSCASLGKNCIGTDSPNTLNITPENLNSMFYDATHNVCYRSIETNGGGDDWESYTASGEVYLSWNAFSVSGTGSITGYNVYRRIAGGTFDYDHPINRSTLSSSATSYLDNAVNSFEAPIPKTVYYYEVRPIINSIPTSTTSNTKVVKVLVPPANKAFIHRWIVNKTICGMMNKTTDPSNDFRCSYEGPGDTGLAAGSNHYDFPNHLIVDRFEAGCNYSKSPECDTADGACIGINDPNSDGITSANPGAIYYSRGNGKCYITADTSTWTEVTGSSAIAGYEMPYLPPLVHVTQSEAATFCSSQASMSGFLGLTSMATALPQKLPTRKEQIAYSLWNTSTLSDSTIATRETGLSLNSSSKCNSSSASGLESSYSDDDSPSSSTLFTLPGTATSGIRSIMTGSEVTKDCSSRFGVQDAVGNVAEWTLDRLTCDNLSTCEGVISTDPEALTGAGNIFRPGLGVDPYGLWKNDGVLGPCVDSNSDDICDSALDSWAIEDERYGAGRFFIPLGLPAHVDIPSEIPTSQTLPYALEIGPTSGITANQLHDDTITYNSHHIFAEGTACGAFATGGRYTDGSGAGIYNFEVLPCNDTAWGYATIGDVSFRSLSPSPSTITIMITTTVVDTVCNAVSSAAVGNAITITIDGDCPSVTATDIVNAVNTDVPSAALVTPVVSGDATAVQSAIASAVTLTDLTSTVAPKRVDVGFRCIAPVSDSLFQP